MKKNKIKKMQLIKRLLKNKLDAAASAYSTIAKMLKSEIEKKEQLEKYKSGYNSNMVKVNDDSVSISSIKQKTIFIAHIESIIKTQQYSILSLQKEAESRKIVWLNLRNKFERLDDYIERMQVEYQNELDVREQKELDTLVNDLYSYNHLTKED